MPTHSCNWTGGADDGLWDSAANWDLVPVAGDNCYFWGENLVGAKLSAGPALAIALGSVFSYESYGEGTILYPTMTCNFGCDPDYSGDAGVMGGHVKGTLWLWNASATGCTVDTQVTLEADTVGPHAGYEVTMRSDTAIVLSGCYLSVVEGLILLEKGAAAFTTDAATSMDSETGMNPYLRMKGITYLGTIASTDAWTLDLQGSTLDQAVSATDLALRIGEGTSTFGGAVECRTIDLAGGTLDCNNKALTLPAGAGITGAGTLKKCPTTVFISEGVIDGGGNTALIRRDGCATATGTGTAT